MNKFEFPGAAPEHENSAEIIPLTKEEAEMIVLNYQSNAVEFSSADPVEFDRIIEKIKDGSYTPQEAIDKADELAPHEPEPSDEAES